MTLPTDTRSVETLPMARDLPGPTWLTACRSAAFDHALALGLPSTDEEVWRYSRIADLDLADYEPVGRSALTDLPGRTAVEPPPRVAAFVALTDGHLRSVEVSGPAAEAGLTVVSASVTDDPIEAIVNAAEPKDVFAALTLANAPDPVVISVPAGVTIDEPILVVNHVTTPGGLSHPHLVISVGADASAVVLDHEMSDDVAALTLPVVDAHVAAAGRLEYVNVQDLGSEVWRIATHRSTVGQQATYRSAQIALGGSYARTRTDCRLAGRGSEGDLLALYFGEGDQMLDFRTFQDHAAPDTRSDLLFKGAVADTSHSVYTGLIKVRPDAHGTNAFQTNRNIKLGDGAWAESVPNLEIENNEVKCSHASTVGPIDEDQRFYLESRGVPPRVAERLIVAGFFDEVIVGLPAIDGLAELVRGRINDRLDRIVET